MGTKKAEKAADNNREQEVQGAQEEQINTALDALNFMRTYMGIFKSEYETERKDFVSNPVFFNALINLQKRARKLAHSIEEEGAFTELDLVGKEFFAAVKGVDRNIKASRIVTDKGEDFNGLDAISYFGGNKKDKMLFNVMKEGFLAAENKLDKEKAGEKYREMKDPTDLLKGRDNILDELTGILRSGDCIGRGSSKAYKEIQSEIKDLKKILKIADGSVSDKPLLKRYATLMAKSISERCHQYLKDRAVTELTDTRYSYKGKRIEAVHKVENRLNAFLESCKEKNVLENDCALSNDVIARYQRMIDRKINTTTFNRSLFAEAKAIPSATNMKELSEMHKTFYDDPATRALTEGIIGMDGKKEEFESKWEIANKYTSFCSELGKNGLKSDGAQARHKLSSELNSLNQWRRDNPDSGNIGIELTIQDDLGERVDMVETDLPKLNHAITKECHKILRDSAKEINRMRENYKLIDTKIINEGEDMSFIAM